jgi:tRNA(fMet)-specific endonuclease VapC
LTYLLDTNVCIALIKSAAGPARERFDRAMHEGSRLAISSVTTFELWFGVAKSAQPQKNHAILSEFLSGPYTLLPFDDGDARVAGVIRAQLEASGKPIGPYDLLIAGQALRHGLTLVTANEREFARVPGLRWKNWAAGRK